MKKRQQITLRQVADVAGVSAPTVSRVLNRHPGVNEEVRKRVTEVIEQLGYNAESIIRKAVVISNAQIRVKTIEIVLFPLPEQEDMFKITYFNDIYAGIQSLFNQTGMVESAISTWLTGWKSVDQIPENLMKRFKQSNGLLLIGSMFPPVAFELAKINPAIVFIGTPTERSNEFNFVSHNDFQAGQLLADYLIQKGAAEIGFLSGSVRSSCFSARLNGVMVQTLHQLGAEHFHFRTAPSSDNKDIMATAAEWLDSGTCPRTVILSHFGAAYLFYNLLRHRNIDPNTYNIATFDAVSGFIPELEFCCMETFPRQLGQKAAQRVLQLVDTPHLDDLPQTILVPCRLLPGNTVHGELL